MRKQCVSIFLFASVFRRKCLILSHAPGTARTCNLQFRRLSLYPVELRVLFTEPLTIGHNVILARRKAFTVRRTTREGLARSLAIERDWMASRQIWGASNERSALLSLS